MKNVRISHILRTFLILHFFEFLKKFKDFTWLEYCLDRLITLRGCLMDEKNNYNPKILYNEG